MHHNGNDFVVVENLNRQIKFNNSYIKKLADRNTGIGFDQLLIVGKPKSKKANFNYKILIMMVLKLHSVVMVHYALLNTFWKMVYLMVVS